MDYSILDLLSLIGAVGLFLYGMNIMSEGLQKVAGDRMRNILGAMTRNRFTGMFTGFSITALIQSSSASTVMVVSFVNAGLMTLAQSMAVIMGANVGTTATAWIVTLFGFKVDIALFALPLIGVALPLMFSKKSRNKSIAELIIGFSLLFIGLSEISANVPELDADSLAFLKQVSDYGFGSVLIFALVGLIITLIIQSSSATFALVLVMCTKGWMQFDLACAMVLGSNIGTTITPILASMGANIAAKRAAMGHLLFNVLGSIWCLALFIPFIGLTEWITDMLGQGDPNQLYGTVDTLRTTDPEQYKNVISAKAIPDNIAAMQLSVSFSMSIFHTLFNLINLSIMIWFTNTYVKIVEWLVPSKNKNDDEFQLKFISTGIIQASELNITQAEKEIAVFGERVNRMLTMSKELVHTKLGSEDFNKLYSRIEKYEDISDRMEIEIAKYLNLCAEGNLSNAAKRHVAAMLAIVSEIESIADCCAGTGKILLRKQQSNIHFNQEIYDNIDVMFGYVQKAMDNMLLLLRNLENNQQADIVASYNFEREINNMRNSLRTTNISNINEHHYEYQEGIFFMDIISTLEKTGDYIINVVDTIRDESRSSKK